MSNDSAGFCSAINSLLNVWPDPDSAV